MIPVEVLIEPLQHCYEILIEQRKIAQELLGCDVQSLQAEGWLRAQGFFCDLGCRGLSPKPHTLNA